MSGPCFAQSAVARKPRENREKTARKKLPRELQGLRSTRDFTRSFLLAVFVRVMHGDISYNF